MKMRARKRYHDSWQVGRELFRLNQRLSVQLRREIEAFPISSFHDDMMDFIESGQCATPQAAAAFFLPHPMRRDPGKSRIQFWSAHTAKTLRAEPMRPDTVWVDEATSLTMHLH